MIDLHAEKYPDEFNSDRLILEGLQLSELADKKPMPTMLNHTSWKTAKKIIAISLAKFVKSKWQGAA